MRTWAVAEGGDSPYIAAVGNHGSFVARRSSGRRRRRRIARRNRRRRGQSQAQHRRGVQGLSHAQPHGFRRRRRGWRGETRRQPGRARLRHHLRRRLAERSGCGRGVCQGSATGAVATGALGMSVEPRAGRTHCGARLWRHEEAAHLVRRRQDRLPHAAHAVSDHAQVPADHSLRRMVRHQAAGGRWPGAGRGRHRADVG